MSKECEKIIEAHQWLLSDQYSYGEWGKCEETNPTNSPRTYEISRIKPNIFISSQAIISLIATGYNNLTPYSLFFDWLHKLRNEEGYWTSASGSLIPAGKGRGWSEVKNIRHTAKALDLLMMRNEFIPADSLILHQLLSDQLDDGSFPQHPEGSSDLWSTAYVINFLIQCLHPTNLPKTLPRNRNLENWRVDLTNHLERARSWICSQLKSDNLWHIGENDPIWITEAVLSEIGAYLSLYRPDLCKQIGTRLLEDIDSSRTLSLWGLLLVLPTLESDQQKKVIDLLSNVEQIEIPKDTFDVSSYCKLLWLKNNPHILSYFIAESSGHESTLKNWKSWEHSEYFSWCVKKAVSDHSVGNLQLYNKPKDRSEIWCSIATLLDCFKKQVEENRGWQLFWNDDGTPRDEKYIQISFWNVILPICKENAVLVREPETGAGPVDFEFINGYKERVYIEFKLAKSSHLKSGLTTQLPTYMNAQEIDSSFYVVIGYNENEKEKYNEIYELAREIRCKNKRMYIQSFFIDASKKTSASKR